MAFYQHKKECGNDTADICNLFNEDVSILDDIEMNN
jgi:hypothetical protein